MSIVYIRSNVVNSSKLDTDTWDDRATWRFTTILWLVLYYKIIIEWVAINGADLMMYLFNTSFKKHFNKKALHLWKIYMLHTVNCSVIGVYYK